MADMGIYRALGGRVARLRRQLGLTQVGLAHRSGMSRASIASIEAGRQRIAVDQLYELGAALGVARVSDLIPMEVPDAAAAAPIEGQRVVSPVQSAQIDGIVRAALSGGRKR